MSIYIRGKQYYFHLVKPDPPKKSAYLYEKISPNNDFLVVCYHCPIDSVYLRFMKQKDKYKNKKIIRLFTYFDNYLDFGQYYHKFAVGERHFFEVINENRLQKPKFDIDCEDENIDINDIISDLLTVLISEFAKVGKSINMERDVLIYTSHGLKNVQEGKRTKVIKKQSAHVTIDNHCHLNSHQAKALYNFVIEAMNPAYAAFVDNKVYGKNQQFRMIGSQKSVGNLPEEYHRIKTFQKDFEYSSKFYHHQYIEEPISDLQEFFVIQLGESVITNCAYCNILPNFIESEKLNPSRRVYSSGKDSSGEVCEIDYIVAEEALSLIAKKAGVKVTDPRFPYRYKGIKEGLILLERVRASNCRVCNRVHHAEHPYLIIVGPQQDVFFNCRRNEENKYWHVGTLKPEELEESERLKDAEETLPRKIPIQLIENIEANNIVRKRYPLKEEKEQKEESKMDNKGDLTSDELTRLIDKAATRSLASLSNKKRIKKKTYITEDPDLMDKIFDSCL